MTGSKPESLVLVVVESVISRGRPFGTAVGAGAGAAAQPATVNAARIVNEEENNDRVDFKGGERMSQFYAVRQLLSVNLASERTAWW
jgi:hypothetical protein